MSLMYANMQDASKAAGAQLDHFERRAQVSYNRKDEVINGLSPRRCVPGDVFRR